MASHNDRQDVSEAEKGLPDDLRDAFVAALPGGVLLDPRDRAGIERYARGRGFIGAEERLAAVSRAGEGNMNLTLRLVTNNRSLILKQARPWVEKYPALAAPVGRSRVELAFYELSAGRAELTRAMPRLLGSDASSSVLALEDLGEAQDFTTLYRQGSLAESDIEELVAFLAALHRPLEGLTSDQRTVFRNPDMRALNHEHIFRLPLARDNGLDLDAYSPGLTDAAEGLKDDARYAAAVAALGRRYLDDGPVLVHGDYFPGSWLRTSGGIRIIDPEFCFLGTAAFDVGVLLAHLALAQKPATVGERVLELYLSGPSHEGSDFVRLARAFAGVEIMRRLIGVAQLPLAHDPETRLALLEASRELVLA